MTRRTIRLAFVFLVVPFSFAFSQKAKSPKWTAWAAEADTLYNSEEYAAAVKLYTKVLDANPMKEGTYEDRSLYSYVYRRAVSYYSLQQFDKALADVDVFESQFPKSPQPKLLKAFIYRERDDVDNQLLYLSQAIDLQPPNPDFLKWRGLLLIQKEHYADALSDLKEARGYGDDGEVETYLGLCYYHTEDPDSAILSFNRAIELNPMHIPTYLYAGSVALEAGDFALCLEYIDLALRIDSKSPEALYYKGVALVELNRLDEGCRCLNRAFYSGFDDAAGYLKEYCFPAEN